MPSNPVYLKQKICKNNNRNKLDNQISFNNSNNNNNNNKRIHNN